MGKKRKRNSRQERWSRRRKKKRKTRRRKETSKTEKRKENERKKRDTDWEEEVYIEEEKGRGEKGRRRPRRTGREVGMRRVNTEGRVQKTTGRRKGGEGRERKEREERGEKEERRRREKGKYETKREKGYGRGWNTRRNENRYDYYREGHVVNRASKVMGKWSKGGRKGNRE